MCQDVPLEDEFDLIKDICRGVKKQVNVIICIRNLDKNEVEVLTMYEGVSLAAELRYHIFEGHAITLRQRTHCELVTCEQVWITHMIIQPNQGCGIMVTFKMDPSIARTEATICICFVDGAMLDCHVGLDCLEVG